MVLEATMLILDNSEWMRNGDYQPTRFEAQRDAVYMVFSAKTQANPENTVGVMTMAGKTPKVLVTLTSEMGKILAALNTVEVAGEASITTGIQVAQLALKHRQNKTQRQRIIVFIASPLTVDQRTLVKLGRKMKKNNVAVDVVSFGELEENAERLEAFVQAVNSGGNCHLLTVPRGPRILSDVLLASPILVGEDGAAPPGFGASSHNEQFEFGVDPNLDPELALVLRMSLEEERQRQEAEAAKQSKQSGDDGAAVGGSSAEVGSGAGGTSSTDAVQGAQGGSSSAAAAGVVEQAMVGDEDELLARALQMSMENPPEQDAMDVDDILSTLPGIDMDDQRVREAKEEGTRKKKKDNNNNDDDDHGGNQGPS